MSTLYWLDTDGNWTNTANWSTGAVPATGDTVYIGAGVQNIATNLNQSGVTLANLIVGMGFTGTIGTTSAALQISATSWTIGLPTTGTTQGSGAARIRIDFGANQFTGTVLETANSSADANLEPVRVIGSNASNVLSVISGIVGVATTLPTQTATVASANVAGGTLNFGPGVTWTSADVAGGGVFTAQTGGTTLTTAPSGTATINGITKVTTVNCGGTCVLNQRPASGNVADTLNLYETGTSDFSNAPTTGTIGTLVIYPGGTWKNSPAVPNHITATTLTRTNGGTLTLG